MSSTADTEQRDEARQDWLDRLGAELGDGVVDSHLKPGLDLWVRIRTEVWAEAGRVARDVLGCEYFCFLSGLDWMPSPFGKGEDDPTQPPPERKTEIVSGLAGGETRFQVFARVTNLRQSLGITMKADVPADTLTIGSWVPNYAGANWHERETYEMLGIRFAGHPDLRKLYLPTDFEGFPLRKDFPLLSRIVKPWPGIVDVEPMPEGADGGESE